MLRHVQYSVYRYIDKRNQFILPGIHRLFSLQTIVVLPPTGSRSWRGR